MDAAHSPYSSNPDARRTAIAVCCASGVAVALAACVYSITAPAGDTEASRVWVQLTPAGAFTPSDGRKMDVPAWRIDRDIATRVIQRFQARKNPAVLDYEHQTLKAEENGQPAPAAGWIDALEWREGSGLWGAVQLTPTARGFIAEGAYRFISPVFIFDTETGEVLAITMAAITNTPAIDGMAPLQARAAATFGFHPDSDPQEYLAMNKLLAAICAALALDPAKTTEDQAIAACAGIKPKLDTLDKLHKELGVEIKSGDDVTTVSIAACNALKSKAEAAASNTPDPAKYVPIDVVESLKTDITALRAEQTRRDVEQLVDEGLEDGRLLEAQKAWATGLGTKNIAALREYLKTAQPIAALRGSQTNGQQPSNTKDEHGLTSEEQAVCKATGIDPKEFAATKVAAKTP